MDEPTPAPEPRDDDIIGHLFDGYEVHPIFRAPDGSQFLMDKVTRERSADIYLAPGETWARWGAALVPGRVYGDRRKAIHEAGHAVVCADEGIRVEYVTVVSFIHWSGTTFFGWCQHDYRLRERIRTDPATWRMRAARFALGGPEAERIHFELAGEPLPDDTRDQWSGDELAVKKAVAASFGLDLKALSWPELKSELNSAQILDEVESLRDDVRDRLLDPKVWGAVESVAARLLSEGAIPGDGLDKKLVS
jgi:hypothetical protein